MNSSLNPIRSLHWWFLQTLACPILAGLTVRQWLGLLKENEYQVSPKYWGRAALATALSCNNSIAKRVENAVYGKRIHAAEVHPPIFVLGCWRSGTTHLHNLLSKDTRFAFPNSFQTLNAHSFLHTEKIQGPIQNLFFPKKRAMDNVAFAADQPQEDEMAIAILSGISPMLALIFWERRHHYHRYTAFQDVSPDEITAWQQSLLFFLKKLTVKYDKPLLLKSPAHTAKIKSILELFPDAKFVMIHRHPDNIVVSGTHMVQKNLLLTTLQTPDLLGCTEEVVEHYGQLFDAYFEQRGLIPEGNLVEIGFDELDSAPLATLRKLYATLSLPEFAEVEPLLIEYIDSLSGYRKNRHTELESKVKELVRSRWRHCFEAWDYR